MIEHAKDYECKGLNKLDYEEDSFWYSKAISPIKLEDEGLAT